MAIDRVQSLHDGMMWPRSVEELEGVLDAMRELLKVYYLLFSAHKLAYGLYCLLTRVHEQRADPTIEAEVVRVDFREAFGHMRELYALEMLGLALFSVHMSVVAIEQGSFGRDAKLSDAYSTLIYAFRNQGSTCASWRSSTLVEAGGSRCT